MLLHLKHILSPAEVELARELMRDDTLWIDGRHTAGSQASTQKNNRQLVQGSEVSRHLQDMVLQALQRDPLFFSAALPKRILPPLFNRYGGAHHFYGKHVDGAVLKMPSTSPAHPVWLRTDVSCTVFLSDPSDYEGGELVVQDTYGNHSIKFAAGDAVLYPGTSVHQVTPVTRGERLAAFFWIESLVRSDEQRRLLFDLDMNLLKLRAELGETPETTALTGVYHNLLRQWTDT
jgi:PKHD-type hydroxylase